MAYKLTPKGEARAMRCDRAKDAESAVMTLLFEEKDALEIEEIAGSLRTKEETAQKIVNRLMSGENPSIKEV